MMKGLWGVFALVFPLLAAAAPTSLQLAWRDGQGDTLLTLEENRMVSRESLPSGLSTPLGSLWKLFVYAYLETQGAQERPYHCNGSDRDEVYCCAVGEEIERDTALVRSCGLYFSPSRLQIEAQPWRQFWQTQRAPDWLQDLQRITPETRVPVHELLTVLEALPARRQAQAVLLETTLNAGDDVSGALGARLRVKTWSWHAQDDAQRREGGFAGWLNGGGALWAQGAGTSKTVLRNFAPMLDAVLPSPLLMPAESGECVVVNLFSRYPLREVSPAGGKGAAPQGALRGRYDVRFANGNRLTLESRGELFLLRDAQTPRLMARLTREEYVARVLEREAKTQPPEAARAMAIAIRSYLQQNAGRDGDCLTIDDSSARQRVAPSPAGKGARAVAAWTADLVLAGAPVTYHYDSAAPGRLSWLQAVEQAQQGMRYSAILAQAFPRATLSRWGNPQSACQPLPAAEAWLQARRRDWRMTLDRESGYAATDNFAICRLSSGRPYTDRAQRRIYVRNFYSLQDRLDLTHEYLHLAFDGHPSGLDEEYIERLTRHLLLE